MIPTDSPTRRKAGPLTEGDCECNPRCALGCVPECPVCAKPKRERLKPCPFCGLDEVLVSFWSSTGRYGVACHADDRKHTAIASGETREEAIAAWNRRPR